MKIRTDYVSNSSSSSFMLVGTSFDKDDLIMAFKKLDFNFFEGMSRKEIKEIESDEDTLQEHLYDVFDEKMDDWFEQLGLDYAYGIDNYYDRICIGLGYDKMNDDETKAAFEKRICDLLERLMGEPQKIECMIDGGQDC